MKKMILLLLVCFVFGCASQRRGEFATHPDETFQKYNQLNVKNCVQQVKQLLKINHHLIPDLRDFVLSRVTDYEILTQRYPRPADFYKGYDKKFPFPQDVLYQFEGGWQGLDQGVANRMIVLSLAWDSQVFLYEKEGSLLPGATYIDHYGQICQIRKTKKGETLVFEGQYFPEQKYHPPYLKWIGQRETLYTHKANLDEFELRRKKTDQGALVEKVLRFNHWKM